MVVIGMDGVEVIGKVVVDVVVSAVVVVAVVDAVVVVEVDVTIEVVGITKMQAFLFILTSSIAMSDL